MILPSTDGLNRAQKLELIGLLQEQDRRRKANRMANSWAQFYDWQRKFAAATKQYHECALIAANQVGKTFTGTELDAFHLTGEYPDDYPGHRYDFAPLCWGLGFSMEKTRDLLQTALFGSFDGQQWSGGLITPDKIINWESSGGTPHAMRTVRVKHRLGTAVMQFWSYSQGQHALMGDVVDHIHVDEEPKDQSIRPQLLIRSANGDRGRGGRIIYTLTPENGRTELVVQFKDMPTPHQFYMQVGWDDAPHMTPEKRERLLAAMPAHQRDMRTKGEPMLGHGRIYDIGEEFITCDPIVDVSPHWRVIHGMDFGWDHPQAHVRLLIDDENDIMYLTKSWKARQTSAADAFNIVKGWGPALTAWPHDGLQHEKGRDDAMQQKDHYSRAGFRMLAESASWLGTNGEGNSRSVEQGLYEIAERMRTGRFKAVRGQLDFFNEFRQYHRDEHGKINKTGDDILDAIRYAYMMRRHAVRVGELVTPQRVMMPQPIRSIGHVGVGRR